MDLNLVVWYGIAIRIHVCVSKKILADFNSAVMVTDHKPPNLIPTKFSGYMVLHIYYLCTCMYMYMYIPTNVYHGEVLMVIKYIFKLSTVTAERPNDVSLYQRLPLQGKLHP